MPLGSELLCFLFAWALTPLIGVAVGRRRCGSHVQARRAFRRTSLLVLATYYGTLAAALAVMYAVHATSGDELPALQMLVAFEVVLAPGLGIVLATLVPERFPSSRYCDRCSSCGYPLNAPDAICSECGRPGPSRT